MLQYITCSSYSFIIVSLFSLVCNVATLQVRLSEKLLISVCAEYNHVRTWSVMRFRGMISTQPGSTPLSSYKILTLEEAEQPVLCAPHANEIGKW